MSERMNKDRAREILKDFSQQLNDRKVMLPTNSEIYKDNEDLLQALDIAIESIEHEEKCNKAINDSAKAIAKMQRLCKKCHTNKEWVDVRDRLPTNDEEEVLVTAKDEWSEWVSINTYIPKIQMWELEEDVIAWKPLPQPYERKEPIEIDTKKHSETVNKIASEYFRKASEQAKDILKGSE